MKRPKVRSPKRWRLENPIQTRLDNGLKILAYPRAGQHIVSAELVLDIPLNAETLQLEGTAAIVAACLTQGTHGHPGVKFAETVEGLGAVLDASAGHSGTQASLDVPGPNLAPALALLAEAVREPALAEPDVLRERDLRLAELDQQLANPSARAALEYRRALIHPRYRAARPVGGLADCVRQITADDAQRFHRELFAPAQATLILAGDFPADPVALAADAFGSWTAEPAVTVAHQSPEPVDPAALLIDRPDAVQAEIRLGSFGLDRAHPGYVALQLACRAMGGTFLSRLNKVLREERGYTYGVHLVNQAMRSGGLLAMQGSFRTDVAPLALAEAMEILDVAKTPITAAEIDDAVAHALGSFPLGLATAGQVAGYVANLVYSGLDLGYPDRFLDALGSIEPEDATSVLAGLLPLESLTLVVVGKAAELEAPLRRAGWEPQVVAT
ncbi:MAG: insulinase family protein [Propionibacteriaceae bacterium]|jgi:predicted Zn-dependent peptidase|nr:insulinase family protein [Propionibacteriaceae bacterium]